MATATRTALVDRIGGWALSRRIGGRLSGDCEDLRRLVTEMKARSGNEYSAKLKELTDPLREAQIADPSGGWYKEKQEYGNLLRFKQKPEAQA
jgi:hypothetical protein